MEHAPALIDSPPVDSQQRHSPPSDALHIFSLKNVWVPVVFDENTSMIFQIKLDDLVDVFLHDRVFVTPLKGKPWSKTALKFVIKVSARQMLPSLTAWVFSSARSTTFCARNKRNAYPLLCKRWEQQALPRMRNRLCYRKQWETAGSPEYENVEEGHFSKLSHHGEHWNRGEKKNSALWQSVDARLIGVHTKSSLVFRQWSSILLNQKLFPSDAKQAAPVRPCSSVGRAAVI